MRKIIKSAIGAMTVVCWAGALRATTEMVTFDTLPLGIITNNLTESDYITDGLVARYDGINNTGTGTHDPSATTWKNLAPGTANLDLSFVGDGSAWAATQNAYSFKGATYAEMVNAFDLATVDQGFTIDLALDNVVTASSAPKEIFAIRSEDAYSSDNLGLSMGGGSLDAAGIYFRWRDFAFFGDGEGTHLEVIVRSSDSESFWDGKHLTGVVDPDSKTYNIYMSVNYDSALLEPSRNIQVETLPTLNGTKWKFAGVGFDQTARYLKADYHAIRFYNRALAKNEIYWNRMIDNARFRGLKHVLVRTQINASGGYVDTETTHAGTETNGFYWVNGTHDFTAHETTVSGGTAYKPNGYTIEVWDAKNNKWGDATTYENANVYSYTNCITTACVRVTWLLEKTGALMSTEPTSADYIQHDLVAHYDGIDNAGTGAHDATATTWKNLVAGGANLEFKKDDTLTDENAWATTQNAYSFKGATYAEMTREFDLANTETNRGFVIEMAFSNVELASDSTAIYAVRSVESYTTDVLGISMDGDKTICRWRDFPFFGERDGSYLKENLGATKDKYITGFVKKGGDILTYGLLVGEDFVDIWKPISSDNMPTIHGTKWKFAGMGQGQTGRYLTADFHSIRFYNRALRTDEYQWNRMVDEARFYGNVTTNVIVAVEPKTVTGVKTGAFQVDTAWTFRPPEAQLNGQTVYPSGYTLETWDAETGTWSKPSALITASQNYTYPNETTPNTTTIRLTWKYTTKGFCIIVR